MSETHPQLPHNAIPDSRNASPAFSTPGVQGDLFTREVTQSWDLARAESRQSILVGRKPTTLALEIRYALMLTAANHPDAEIPYDLLISAVKQGVLNPDRAFPIASQISGLQRRVDVLTSLSAYLPEPKKGEALALALAASQEPEREMDRWWLFIRVLPDLTESFLPQALSIARELQDPWYRATTLESLVPLTPEHQKSSLLDEVLVAARSIPIERGHTEFLTRLVPSLPDAEKSLVLEEALSLALPDPDQFGRALNLEDIAEMFVQMGQAEQAYSAVLAIPGHEIRVRALQKVAPHLQPDQQQEAFEHALAAIWDVDKELDKQMEVDESRSHVLAQLIPELPESLRLCALEQVRRSPEDFDRFWSLVTLAANLPEPWKNQAATEALAELADSPNHPQRVWRLLAVARHLTEPMKSQALADAYTTAQVVDEPFAQAFALMEVAPYLTQVQRDAELHKVLLLSQTFGGNQTYVLEHLAALHVNLGSAEQATAAIRAIPSELLRIRALVDIAPAILEHARLNVYSIWSEILQALSTQPRAELLRALPALRTILELLGDEQAGVEMTRAIHEVCQSWP